MCQIYSDLDVPKIFRMSKFCCLWPSVQCDNGRVSSIDLSNNFCLSGTISSLIGDLTYLRYLDISSSQLEGTIPESLGSLEVLEWLDLGENKLTNTIPSSIGQMKNLEKMHLAQNSLTGYWPTSEFN